MQRRHFSEEQIIAALREAEAGAKRGLSARITQILAWIAVAKNEGMVIQFEIW